MENQIPENGDLENLQNLSLSSADLPPSDAQISQNYMDVIISAFNNSDDAAAAQARSVLPLETTTVARIRPVRPPRRYRPLRPPAADETLAVPPPYRWAGDRPCSIHSLARLLSENILTISGDVRCRKCGGTYKVEYDLSEKYSEMLVYVTKHVPDMRQRAHRAWMEPPLVECQLCMEESCVGPAMHPDERESINWLFLLLGQMLGFCDVNQLRYFCKHNGNTLTGSKDMVLFRVYLTLFDQLHYFPAFFI